MANVLINEETLTQIANAIREKSGSKELFTPGEMPEAILAISTYSGEGADASKPVRFYGPYGDLVYSYSVDELSAMTELPALPEYDGLLGEAWNWSLENAKSVNGEVEIGSLYITDNGDTRIYIELVEGALSPKLGFKQNVANAFWIDWGDGSELDSSEAYGDEIVSLEHTYAESGEYVISLIPEEGAEISFVGYSTGTLLLHLNPESDAANRRYANAIRRIELGSGISKLTNNCFMSETLKSVTIPSSITAFEGAFSGCISLESITFPVGVTSVKTREFSNCYALKKLLFSESRITLYTYPFEYCHSLETVVISNNWNDYSYDFSNCHGLKRVVLPSGMTKIVSALFTGCAKLEEVVIRGNITVINSDAFRGCYLLEKLELPDSVTSIGSYGLYGCYKLRELKLPSSLTTIGNTAFGNCYSLRKVEIPESVTSIEKQAFLSCYSVTEYCVYPTTPPTLGSSNVFYIPDGCNIYVPKGCLEAYQTAEYWSTYADYMVEMEE